VAVKVLKIDKFDPEQMECIEREIALHQKLMHEHIAQIYEVVRKPNKIYIIMEHCAKGELFDYITNNGPLGEREAARIFHEVLSALLYLKHMGISHRDVKPENILFDQERKVKLVDFGFSCKYLGEEDVFRWTICGTPSYTPPEILL
jgi:serine/threonine protein kinase